MEVVAAIIFVCMIVVICLIPTLFVFRMVAAIFSPLQRDAIRKQKILHCFWFVVSALVAVGVLFPGHGGLKAALRAKTNSEMEQVLTAIYAYQTEYGVPPQGKDNVDLVKILIGDNPRQISFINLKPSDQNDHGDMLDAWKTPLRIIITDSQHVTVRSAGPDKTWDTPDDMHRDQTDWYDPTSPPSSAPLSAHP